MGQRFNDKIKALVYGMENDAFVQGKQCFLSRVTLDYFFVHNPIVWVDVRCRVYRLAVFIHFLHLFPLLYRVAL